MRDLGTGYADTGIWIVRHGAAAIIVTAMATNRYGRSLKKPRKFLL